LPGTGSAEAGAARPTAVETVSAAAAAMAAIRVLRVLSSRNFPVGQGFVLKKIPRGAAVHLRVTGKCHAHCSRI
jgi:hypothetical protein